MVQFFSFGKFVEFLKRSTVKAGLFVFFFFNFQLEDVLKLYLNFNESHVYILINVMFF